jgi:isoleucyl-tRNA synthetase
MSESASIFTKVPNELNFPKEEREILALWKEKRVFERTLEKPSSKGDFIFYEGPPTANGLPHNGHVLTRVIKDLFPRYKTMRGYRVPRKAGWDTHGLPVEVEVEKELRIHGKAAIEEYGVEPFIAKCIQSVFRYTSEWENLTERVGFWVDLKEAYVTYHKSYVESCWWALSELFKKGLLYQGHKVVWWWAQGGTALSSGEVGQGYKEVDDPSVYVAFPLESDPTTCLLVWTTTPCTLPSNAYAAVNPSHAYVYVRAPGDAKRYVVAKELVPALAKKLKTELAIEGELTGKELAGQRYIPPFDVYAGPMKAAAQPEAALYWQIILADFVELGAGTGIVHIAPAFGEDDFNAHKKELKDRGLEQKNVTLLCAVKPDGTFIPEMGRWAGRWVKDCDKEIQDDLKQRGLLVFAEQYRHDYPFCWRADNDPLIQYARPAWYVATTQKIGNAIANNQQIGWLPEHIKDGRFGDFLANNVDWALSRERYWGTPLNIWINDATGKMEAPSSTEEILKKNPHAFDHFHAAKQKDPELSEHLIVHKPWIDQVTWQNPGEEGTYRRVPDVIDCWFDSGCMPFAQWGFPHKGHAEFKQSFPADFISEALDQTRGWFYTLLMISTLVFDDETQRRFGLDPIRPYPHPYKNCIVLGHVSDKEGKKESKSKGNYTPPEVILDRVEMEFAVLEPKDAAGVTVKPGFVAIAREDLEGLDLQENAKVRLKRGATSLDVVVTAGKKMRRRVVAMHEDDRKALGVTPTGVKDVKPVEVPRLPETERVMLEDPTSPAPGADAFRWFFYASNPPWNATRHSLSNVRALQKETLVKLRNVYSFFTIYGNIDGFDPYASAEATPSLLDRWISDLTARTATQVALELDRYDLYEATKYIAELVDALSNWYVRRSRDRFWKSGWDADKRAAYATLYESLVTLARVMAPFTPFFSETMYQNLVVGPAARAGRPVEPSVHLTSFPEPTRVVDEQLQTEMKLVRGLVSLGLQVRTQAKLKVRQPLRSAKLIVSTAQQQGLMEYAEMIKEELNVLAVELVPDARARDFVEFLLKPNFRTLGQKGLGKEAQELKKVLGSTSPEDTSAMLAELATTGSVMVAGVHLAQEDVEIGMTTKEGFAAAGDRRFGVVVLESTLDDELKDLGFVRELQNRVQGARKEMELEYADRVRVRIEGSDRVQAIMTAHKDALAKEVLAVEVLVGGLTETIDADTKEHDVDGEKVRIAVTRA